MTLYQLAKIHSNLPPYYIKVDTLYSRLRRGYSLDKALNHKVTKSHPVHPDHPYKTQSYFEMLDRKSQE